MLKTLRSAIERSSRTCFINGVLIHHHEGIDVFKLSIFAKLFLVLFIVILLTSGALLGSVHWSFKQGFSQYLLQAEANQLDKVVTLLTTAYQKNGNWEFLRDNPHAWIGILRQGLDQQLLPPKFLHDQFFDHPAGRLHDHPPGHDHPPPFENGLFRPGPHGHHDSGPPPGPGHRGGPDPNLLAKFLGSRIQLLDANKDQVVGFPHSHSTVWLRPIELEQRIIGWLSIEASDLITDHLAQLFVTQQIRNNALIAAFTICFAVLCAFGIARKLLVPIQRIAGGANALVRGDYATQIKVGSCDELGQLAENFNLLARTLQSNEQARRRWIADISHELRTPLAILRGELEAVQDGVRDFSSESIKSLHAEVMSLNRLVDDLYELSLSDLGSSHYQKEALDVIDILLDVIHNQSPRFQDRQLELRANFDEEQYLPIQGDSRRLHQLFSNLCENSRRYTSSGGFCEVTVQAKQDRIIIHFADSPPGVPEEALNKLFDRLYRVDTSRNRELGGAGLGLAICQAIALAHQGSINAQHSTYGGLDIRIELPRLSFQ